MHINGRNTSTNEGAASRGVTGRGRRNSRDPSVAIPMGSISESASQPQTQQTGSVSSLPLADSQPETVSSNNQSAAVSTSATRSNPSAFSQHSAISNHSNTSEESANSGTQLIQIPGSISSYRPNENSDNQASAPCIQRVTEEIRQYTNPAVQLQAKYTSRYSIGGGTQSSNNATKSAQNTDCPTCPPCPQFPTIYPGNLPTTSAPTTTTALSSASSSTTQGATSAEAPPSAASQIGIPASFQAGVWASNGLQVELEARNESFLYGNRQVTLHSEAGAHVDRFINLEVSANTGVSVTREGESSVFTSTRARFNVGIRGSGRLTSSSHGSGEASGGVNIRTEHHWDRERRSNLAYRGIGAVLGASHIAGAAAGFVFGSNFAAPAYGTSVGGAAGSILATHSLNMFPMTRSDRIVRSTEPEFTLGGAVNIHVGSSSSSILENRDSVDLLVRVQPRIRFEAQTEEIPIMEEIEGSVRRIPSGLRQINRDGSVLRHRGQRVSFSEGGNRMDEVEMEDMASGNDMTSGSNHTSTDV